MGSLKDSFTPDPDEVDQVVGFFTSRNGLIAIGFVAVMIVVGIIMVAIQ